MQKAERIKEIKKEAASCRKCDFWSGRKNVVFGEGSVDSKVIFVGEAPGYNEDVRGVPFCGKAGAVLDRLLESVELKREDIYITNIIKCRPPDNRDPQDEEIFNCSSYLDRQIELINPGVICCLGRHAVKHVFGKFDIKEQGSISMIHGKVFDVSQDIFSQIKVVALYHPAVAVYNPHQFGALQKDFRVIREI